MLKPEHNAATKRSGILENDRLTGRGHQNTVVLIDQVPYVDRRLPAAEQVQEERHRKALSDKQIYPAVSHVPIIRKRVEGVDRLARHPLKDGGHLGSRLTDAGFYLRRDQMERTAPVQIHQVLVGK